MKSSKSRRCLFTSRIQNSLKTVRLIRKIRRDKKSSSRNGMDTKFWRSQRFALKKKRLVRKWNPGLTLYMKAAKVRDFPSIDVLSVSMYCYLKYTSIPFQVKCTLRAPYVTILDCCYEVDPGEVGNDLDQEVRQHIEFKTFESMLMHHLDRLELTELHYLIQRFPTFEWAGERFASIKERLDLHNLCENDFGLMGETAFQQISTILRDNVTLFRIIINEREWPIEEKKDYYTVLEKWDADLIKTIHWDFNPLTTLDITLTRILLVINKLVDTPIYDEFVKYPNLVTYLERFICKFVKANDVVDLSLRRHSFDFVERKITQSVCIGEGGYGKVYLCEFPQGNPTGLLEGTYAVKACKSKDTYYPESYYLSHMKYDTISLLFGHGNDAAARQYLIMEYISGGTLDNKIGELEYSEALTIMIDVCNGIHAIHSHEPRNRLIHDDLTPKNILLTEDGRAKVIDVGEMCCVGSKTSYSSSIYKEAIPKIAAQSRDIYSIGILMIRLFTTFVFEPKKNTNDALNKWLVTSALALIRENIRESGCDSDREQKLLRLI